MIVVFASLSVLRLSQGAAMAGTAGTINTASRINSKACRVFIMENSPLVRQFLLKIFASQLFGAIPTILRISLRLEIRRTDRIAAYRPLRSSK